MHENFSRWGYKYGKRVEPPVHPSDLVSLKVVPILGGTWESVFYSIQDVGILPGIESIPVVGQVEPPIASESPEDSLQNKVSPHLEWSILFPLGVFSCQDGDVLAEASGGSSRHPGSFIGGSIVTYNAPWHQLLQI